MIVEKDIARQIRSGKRNMLRLSAKSGRCPYRPNSVYVIQTTRGGPTECVITITDVQSQLFEDEPVWILRFKKGDHTDPDRFLSARTSRGDYTSVAKLKLSGTDSEVSKDWQAKYSSEATEGLTEAKRGRYEDAGQRLLSVVSEIQEHSTDPRTSERLRGVERQCRSILSAKRV